MGCPISLHTLSRSRKVNTASMTAWANAPVVSFRLSSSHDRDMLTIDKPQAETALDSMSDYLIV